MSAITGSLPTSVRSFDRSSWLTLGIGLSILGLTIVVLAVASRMPSDGWLVDTGLWGRFASPIYLGSLPGINETLRAGDVLLEVEGESFEILETRAAELNPIRPDNWEVGEEVYYKVLRDEQEVVIPIALQRPPLFPGYRPPILSSNINVMANLIVFALGVLLMILRPRQRAAQLLFLFATSLIVADMMEFGLPAGLSDMFSRWTYWPRLIMGDLILFILLMPVLLHFLLTFPTPKKIVMRHYLLIPGVYGLYAAFSVLYMVASLSGYFIIGEIYFASIVILTVVTMGVILVHSLISIKEPVPRMQMRWIAFGALIGIAFNVTFSLIVEITGVAAQAADPSISYFWYGLTSALLFLALPASIAVAVLRYRLWDIEVIINRSLVYGSLTLILGLIYFGGVVLLQGLFRALASQNSPLAIVISTLVIAALFSPLRRRVQRFIDRSFYRSKYDAEQILGRFALSVRDEADLNRLTAELQRAAMSAMQARHVSIWLKEPAKDS